MNNEINSLGKKISDFEYNTIEIARQAAQVHQGNEAIIRNENGTYSLFKISDSKEEEEKKIKKVEEMLEKGMSSNFNPNLIEFSIDGNLFNSSLRVELASEIKDIDGIGSKINGNYLDNLNTSNRFNSIDSAVEAAKRHKGIEAIVKNLDNSFSLYRATEDEVEKIRELSGRGEYRGNVIKFVVPEPLFWGIPIAIGDNVIDLIAKPERVETETNLKFVEIENLPEITAPVLENIKNSEITQYELDFNRLKKINFNKFENSMNEHLLLNKSLQDISKAILKTPKDQAVPGFSITIKAIFNDSKISSELKKYLNNSLNIFDDLIKAMEEKKPDFFIKDLLNQKIGDDRKGDLIKDMIFMASYYEYFKNDPKALNLTQVFKMFGGIQEKMKIDTKINNVSRTEIYAELNKHLPASQKILFNKLSSHFGSNLIIENDYKQHSATIQTGYSNITQNVRQDSKVLTEITFNMKELFPELESNIFEKNELEKIEKIIQKANSGPGIYLSTNDLKNLKNFKDNLIKLNEDKKFLSDAQIDTLKKFEDSFQELQVLRKKSDDATKARTQAVLHADSTVTKLTGLISNLNPANTGEQALLDVISPIFENYKSLVKEGDQLKIALYSIYMEEVTQFITDGKYKEKPDGLKGLFDICSAYEELVLKMNELLEKHANGDLIKLKEEFLNIITPFVGNENKKLFSDLVNSTAIIDDYQKAYAEVSNKKYSVNESLANSFFGSLFTFKLDLSFSSNYSPNYGNSFKDKFSFGKASPLVNQEKINSSALSETLKPSSINMARAELNFSPSRIPDKPSMSSTNFEDTSQPTIIMSMSAFGAQAAWRKDKIKPEQGKANEITLNIEAISLDDKPNHITLENYHDKDPELRLNSLIDGTIKVESFKILENPVFPRTFNKFGFKKDISIIFLMRNDLMPSLNQVISATKLEVSFYSKIKTKYSELTNIISGAGESDFSRIFEIIKREHQAMERDRNENNNASKKLNTIINDILSKVRLLIDKFDVIELKSENISSLLQRFREIIADLDLKINQLQKNFAQKTEIDLKFLKSLKETRDRWQKLDDKRIEEQKIFKNSKEVKVINLSQISKITLFKKEMRRELNLLILEYNFLLRNMA